MGRQAKRIVTEIGIDRRETGYYSTPTFVAEFIASTLLKLNPHGKSALDPCIGCGEMALPLVKRGIAVDGMDVLAFNLPEGIVFRQQNFLEFYREKKLQCILDMPIDLPYDFYIANPPYNCHEVSYIKDNKSILLSLFDEIGVHNMYSMFISALIDCAKEKALIGIITLDSFLTAKAHTSLRHKILKECAIHYLILCPNQLFLEQGADVRTCIMILQKGKQYQREVQIANRSDLGGFQNILKDKLFCKLPLEKVILDNFKDNGEFIITIPEEIRALFSFPRLGQTFDCITGISTGNDKKYLSKEKRPGFNVPFYKNPGSCRFYTKPNAYLTDDYLSLAEEVPNFTVRNKEFLFKPGITCSSMGVRFTACYLPQNSTYGVNANIIARDSDTWWLLAYLNSYLVTFIVRGVLNRSNMITSGYVSRIPVPEISVRGKERLSQIAQEAYNNQVLPQEARRYILKINGVLQEELALSDETMAILKDFAQNIVKAT